MTSNMQPLLSICCLGYNHANYLTDNLESISRLNYPNIEVIVVDDGSSDQSVELLNDLITNFKYPIKLIAQQNTGNIGLNFNNAIKHANGEYITFISLDDVFNSKIFTNFLEIIIEDKSLAFVSSSKAISINNLGYIDFDKPGKLPIEDISNPNIDDLLELEYKDFGAFYIQGAIFRKDLIDKINGFDEDMTGDDIVLRTKIFLFLKDHPEYNYKIIHKPSVFYRLHDTNIHKNSIRQIKIISEYLGKYWPNKPLPQTFIDWSLHSIKHREIAYVEKIIYLNPTTKRLMDLESIQKAINKTKPSFIKKYIFNKTRVQNDKKITILGFLSFSYTSLNLFKIIFKTQKPTQTNIHYHEYK